MVYAIITKVKKTLKKYFIPHEGNDHKPHMLRTEKALIVLSIVLVVETLFLAQIFVIGKGTNFLAAVISSVIVDKTNEERINFDLNSLVSNNLLELAAQLKANDMAKKGYFSHNTPEGFTPWYWLERVGYSYSAAGENLAVNFTDSEDVVNAWMDSPGHRANILKDKYTQIGVATAKGEYKGRQAIFVVQYFGTPSVAAAQTAPTQQVATQTPEPTPAPTPVAETKPSTTEQVASEATKNEPIEQTDTFIETEPIEVVSNAGSAIQSYTRQSSVLEEIASEPKTMANYMLLVLATIIGVALLLFVFMKTEVKHPPLIVNGVALLVIMSSAILLNQYLSTLGAAVT